MLKYARNLTEYIQCVAMETTLIDIHSDNILVSVGQVHIYVS